MRIISGEYGGRVLKSPSDQKTRPTSDRLRETLFNILVVRIDENTRFLDLCAGTGAIGIEAISRGAGFATFVDRSRRACALIEKNLDHLQVPENLTEVFCIPAHKFLSKQAAVSWDIIYFDPPYSENYVDVLRSIGAPASVTLSPNGVFIAEHHSKNNLPDLSGEIRRWRLLNQGESSLSFYEKR
ncbi:MAG: 16S rRNA (guanine(966)-N(2))-methyltransferase RsmD [Acidobacteria bacterium]|nr:16S rRNA (guanine(966)-N(2))-methyltransferase RsmD [Acidobacteriota bacterium]